MRHRPAAAIAALALIAGACSGGASPEQAPAPAAHVDLQARLDSGPQLETLNYIRQQVETRVAADIALITDELRWGPGGWVVESHPDEDWYDTRKIHVTAGRCYIGSPDSNATTDKCAASNTSITITFGGPIYDTSGGTYATHNCRTNRSAEAVSTGEFTNFDNRGGDSDLQIDYTRSLETGSETSTTLDESLQVTNSLTIEGDVPLGGKVSDTLETQFGISKSKTEGSHVTRTNSVEVTGTVTQGHWERVVYTDAPSSTSCDVTMSGLADWTKLAVELPEWYRYPLLGLPETRNSKIIKGSVWYHAPASTKNHDGQYQNGHLALGGINDLLRIFNGTTSRCVHCDQLDFSARAHEAFTRLSDPKTSHVSFSGTQTTNATSDAGYTFVDVTGFSQGCRDRTGEQGHTASELSACKTP